MLYKDSNGQPYYRPSVQVISKHSLTEIEQAEYDELVILAQNPVKSDSEIANLEYEWAKSELESSDIEIKYHERNSKRAKLTVEQWYEYQEQLRDYATVKDGAYSTEGDRPTRPE